MSERTLMFLRHAEAAPTPSGGRDRDRSLTAAGVRQAEAVGVALAGRPRVEHVLCSPAHRTRQTLDHLHLQGNPTIEFPAALYDAGADDIATMISELPADHRRVLIIGHAPGVPGLVHDLADPRHSAVEARAAIESRYPPATLAVITATGSWSDFTETRLDEVLLWS